MNFSYDKLIIKSKNTSFYRSTIIDFLLFLLFFHEVASVKDVHFSHSSSSLRPGRHHYHRHRLLIYVRVPKVLLLLCVVGRSPHWVFGCVPSRNLPGTIRFYWAADLHTALQFNFGPRRGESCAESTGRGGGGNLASLITSNKTLCRTRAGTWNGNLIFTRRHLGKSIWKKEEAGAAEKKWTTQRKQQQQKHKSPA